MSKGDNDTEPATGKPDSRNAADGVRNGAAEAGACRGPA